MHLCMSAFLHLFSIRIVDTCCVCPTAGWDSKTPIALLLHSNAMGIMSCLLLRNTTGQKNARCSLPQDRKRCRAESKRAACTFDGQAAGMQAAARLVGWREAFQERRVQHESRERGDRHRDARACECSDAEIHKCSHAAMHAVVLQRRTR